MSSVYGVMAAGQWEEVARRVGLAIELAQGCGLREASDVLALHLSPFLAMAPGTLNRIARYAGWTDDTFGDHPLTRLGAGAQHAFTALLRGDVASAHQHATEVADLPDRLGGLPYQSSAVDWTLASVALVRGDLGAAGRHVGEQDVDEPISWARLVFRARLDRLRGRPGDELLHCFEGRSRQERAIAPHTQIVERSLRAQVAWGHGDLSAAEEELRGGIEVQERLRLLPFVADVRLDLAVVLHASGRRGEAVSELDRFLGAAEAWTAPGLGLLAGPEAIPLLLRTVRERRPHQERVRWLLAILDADHRPEPVAVPTTRETLTSREVEVLRLIAAGATNTEIAEQLVISANTVKTHVRRVLAKVGAGSRAQAVVAARRLGVG